MADTDDLDRTESPTQKRLEDARQRGQVPRSRDLGAAAVTLAGGLGLYGLGAVLGGRLMGLMRGGLELSAAQSLGGDSMLQTLASEALGAVLAVAPILGLLLAAAILAPLAIGGWNFSVFVAATTTRPGAASGFSHAPLDEKAHTKIGRAHV